MLFSLKVPTNNFQIQIIINISTRRYFYDFDLQDLFLGKIIFKMLLRHKITIFNVNYIYIYSYNFNLLQKKKKLSFTKFDSFDKRLV